MHLACLARYADRSRPCFAGLILHLGIEPFLRDTKPSYGCGKHPIRGHGLDLLVQPEMDRGRCPLASIPPFGRDFQGIYKTTRLSLGMVASAENHFRSPSEITVALPVHWSHLPSTQ
jgi:hypothetical protein